MRARSIPSREKIQGYFAAFRRKFGGSKVQQQQPPLPPTEQLQPAEPVQAAQDQKVPRPKACSEINHEIVKNLPCCTTMFLVPPLRNFSLTNNVSSPPQTSDIPFFFLSSCQL